MVYDEPRMSAWKALVYVPVAGRPFGELEVSRERWQQVSRVELYTTYLIRRRNKERSS